MPISLKDDLEEVWTSFGFHRQLTVVVKCLWKADCRVYYSCNSLLSLTGSENDSPLKKKQTIFCILQTLLSDLKDFQAFFFIFQTFCRPSMHRMYWWRNYWRLERYTSWSKRLFSDWKGSRFNHELELHRQRKFYWFRRWVFIWRIQILF